MRTATVKELDGCGANILFSVVSNYEFLKEGATIEDFMRPDRIVVGADDEKASVLMMEPSSPFQRNHDRLLEMGVRSAALTEYAANSMLATRISFMNELANLAEVIRADIELVRSGIGSDPRIGYHFLYTGCGCGGSRFPKDVKAVLATARENGRESRVLKAVGETNETQKSVLPAKVRKRFGSSLAGRRLALWGLSFKRNANDMREAPSRRFMGDFLGPAQP